MRQTKYVLAALAALLTLLALAACGGSGEADDKNPIEVTDATATVTMEKGAVYFTIKNHTKESDWLISAESREAPAAELHETSVQGTSASMQPLDRLEVPAGGQAVLEPGGVHIMLDGVSGPLKEGGTLHVSLHFEKAGLIEIEPEITRYSAEPEPSDTGGMGDMGGH